MAEAIARMLACPAAEVYSAGLRPTGFVNQKAVDAMPKLGYDLSRHQSKRVDAVPEIEYDTVVSIGCGNECLAQTGRLNEEWDIPDPRYLSAEEFRSVRDSIYEKVVDLLNRLHVQDLILNIIP